MSPLLAAATNTDVERWFTMDRIARNHLPQKKLDTHFTNQDYTAYKNEYHDYKTYEREYDEYNIDSEIIEEQDLSNEIHTTPYIT